MFPRTKPEGQHPLEDLANKVTLETVSEEQSQFSADQMIFSVWYFKGEGRVSVPCLGSRKGMKVKEGKRKLIIVFISFLRTFIMREVLCSLCNTRESFYWHKIHSIYSLFAFFAWFSPKFCFELYSLITW